MRAVETIVQTNAPGKILPILSEELDDFDTEATRFLAGGYADEAVFQGFRLKQGVYGQRQPNVQMMRVKLPFGGVTPEQMEAFAELADRIAPLRKGHITTRQNVQFHHMPLTKAMEALRLLAKAGLSTREACGNTVRNVTADPWAGVTAGELFDVTPYAGAFARFWLRNPLTQLLPRKFKVAFSADDTDIAITGMHDLGFIPRIRNGMRGFRMVCGGGLAIMPREAIVVREFVPVDEYLKVSEAVIRIFNAADMLRKNRAMARIKVLIDRIGAERFLEMVDEELASDWAQRDFSPERLLFLDNEEERAPSRRTSYEQPANDDAEAFRQFVASNVKAQKQQGFSTVQIKITRGDLTPGQFRGIAAIMRDYCGGNARTTVQQNLVLRWVRDESLYEVYSRLADLDLAEAGADTVTDVVSCPGTDSCKLGITSSMGLNRAIQERVAEIGSGDPLVAKLHIKMSGCPNSCGQHHLANIGFHGAAMKVKGHQLPAYHAFIGGAYANGHGMRVGTQLKLRLPAKRTPAAVQRWIDLYQRERREGEEFNDYFDRAGKTRFEEAVRDLTIPGEFSEDNREMFIDWTKYEIYVLERGEGECAV